MITKINNLYKRNNVKKDVIIYTTHPLSRYGIIPKQAFYCK